MRILLVLWLLSACGGPSEPELLPVTMWYKTATSERCAIDVPMSIAAYLALVPFYEKAGCSHVEQLHDLPHERAGAVLDCTLVAPPVGCDPDQCAWTPLIEIVRP